MGRSVGYRYVSICIVEVSRVHGVDEGGEERVLLIVFFLFI